MSAEFPFSKKRVSVLDSSIAYVDTEAPTPKSPVIVFVHGNPTSSYIWRNIIRHLSPIARCIAADLVGFVDSGKMPSNTYRVRDHIEYFGAFMDAVLEDNPIQKFFLVIQDGASALGFHCASTKPELPA